MRKRKIVTFFAAILTAALMFSAIPTFAYANNPPETDPRNEAREKYHNFLDGSYNSTELREKFYEMYGNLSREYILENYTELFGVSKSEMDETVLDILTYDIDIEIQKYIEETGDRGEWFLESLMKEDENPIPIEAPLELIPLEEPVSDTETTPPDTEATPPDTEAPDSSLPSSDID